MRPCSGEKTQVIISDYMEHKDRYNFGLPNLSNFTKNLIKVS